MRMDQAQLRGLLKKLLSEGSEFPWLEFKDSYFEPHLLGEYLSALANAACLDNREKGYLVFGVRDADRSIVGTSFRFSGRKYKGQLLEFWLKQLLAPKIGFDVYEFAIDGKDLVLFAVNAATGQPVTFDSIAYIRIDSSKTLLKSHPDLQRRLWLKGAPDWTAGTISESTIADLDQGALLKAREEYKVKHQNTAFSHEVDGWDDLTFLNKSRLAIDGELTRAAIILLGKPESVHFIQPSVAQITWILKDSDGMEVDYMHFHPPFLLNVDRLLAKIRNLTLRTLPDGTLFPIEISQYDAWVMREALHNCIAHQDYGLCSRVTVIEHPDSLLFVNAGAFLPGSVENVLKQDAPQRHYLNRQLTDVMVNLNMIDTIGSGIKRMFVTQKKRFMPLPGYDLSKNNEVRLTLPGKILNLNYTRMLMEHNSFSLEQVILLDRVQKGLSISPDARHYLRSQGLIEGRYPNIFVSSKVVAKTGGKSDYTKIKAFDNQYYQDLILAFIRQHGSGKPEELTDLLLDKLSDALTNEQKRDKIRNLLQTMRRKKLIRNVGARGSQAKWVLS